MTAFDSLTPQPDMQDNGQAANTFSRWVWNVILVAIAAILVSGVIVLMHTASTAATPKAPAIVTITDKGFVPQTMTIQVGQSVLWINDASSKHQIAADPYPANNSAPAGLNDPVPLLKGQSYGFTYTSKGSYNYHDQLNPYNFKGNVIVK